MTGYVPGNDNGKDSDMPTPCGEMKYCKIIKNYRGPT
jgi:hypothetical protein